MSKITGIGIALLLVICVPKILSFYDISLSDYGPYLAFLVFIVILAFILPHNFLVTVDTVANAAKNVSESSDISATATSNATSNEGLGVEENMNPGNQNVRAGKRFGVSQGEEVTGERFGVTEGGNSAQQYNNNNYSGSGMDTADLRDMYGSRSSSKRLGGF